MIGTIDIDLTPSPDNGVYYITINKTDCDDYQEKIYLEEEKEWAKTGWHNPKTLGIPKQAIYSKIRQQIRNKLPTKKRPVLNGL